MMNTKIVKGLVGTLVLTGLILEGPSTTDASSKTVHWTPRTSKEITKALEKDPKSQAVSYTIVWGDTLSEIAEAMGVDVENLAQINAIQDKDIIYPGTTLKFDRSAKTVTVEAKDGEKKTYDLPNVHQGQTEVKESQSSVVEQKEKTPEVPAQGQGTTAQAQASKPADAGQNQAANKAEQGQAQANEQSAPVQKEQGQNQAKAPATKAEEKPAAPVQQPAPATPAPKTAPAAQAPAPTPKPAPQNQAPQGQTLTVVATAYSRHQAGLSNMTASGVDLSQNPNVIAVDPSVIPLGSRVYIEGYGEFLAADTGGAIKGNRIDVHLESIDACYAFGRRTLKVTILK